MSELKDKLETLLGKFKFEYSQTNDDIRQQNYVAVQSCDFEGSSMHVEEDLVPAEQKCYGHGIYAMPVVISRIQAVTTECYTMPVEEYPQRVVL